MIDISEPEFLLPRGKQKDKKKARASEESAVGRCNNQHPLWFTYYYKGAQGEWVKGCHACDQS